MNYKVKLIRTSAIEIEVEFNLDGDNSPGAIEAAARYYAHMAPAEKWMPVAGSSIRVSEVTPLPEKETGVPERLRRDIEDFRKGLAEGFYGGYTTVAWMRDGDYVCIGCATKEADRIAKETADPRGDAAWRFLCWSSLDEGAAEVCQCANCNKILQEAGE